MLIGLAACIASIALGVFWLARASFTISSNLQGRADPSGSWAIAWGIALGPLALTTLAAPQVKPFLSCHLFGKQLARVPLSRFLERKKQSLEGDVQATNAESRPGLEAAQQKRGSSFLQNLDPLEAVLSWWESERVLALDSLIVDVTYSFRDIALTGRILAAIYVLSAVLPEGYEVRQTPDWESVDRGTLEAEAKLRFWPGRLVVWAVGFVLKQRAEARANARLTKRATESS